MRSSESGCGFSRNLLDETALANSWKSRLDGVTSKINEYEDFVRKGQTPSSIRSYKTQQRAFKMFGKHCSSFFDTPPVG